MAEWRPTVWRNWTEWSSVFDDFRSDDVCAKKRGVQRVHAWRTRGKVPVAVCATASLVEATLQDTDESPLSQWSLRQLYSMSLIRLVNSLVDTAQRGQYAQSVDSILRQLEWPSWLGELRHQATHGSLPSLEHLRLASQTALSVLCDRFWMAQQKKASAEKCAENEGDCDKRRIYKLVARLFTEPTEDTVQECVACCDTSSHCALMFATAVINRTVEAGTFEPLQALCCQPLPPKLKTALEALQKPLQERLFSSTTAMSRTAGFCKLFVDLGMDTSRWKTLRTVADTVHISMKKKRAPMSAEDVAKDAQIRAFKRRKTCAVALPWTPLGSAWSWDAGPAHFFVAELPSYATAPEHDSADDSHVEESSLTEASVVPAMCDPKCFKDLIPL